MRKQAALWSCIALLISVAFAVHEALGPYNAAGGYLLVPVLAFAGALAIHTGFLSGPWLSSFTWLLNGIMAAFGGFEAAFQWRYFVAYQPLRFVVLLVVLVASVLNTIVLYPRSPKRASSPDG